jgi:hypothetical protein
VVIEKLFECGQRAVLSGVVVLWAGRVFWVREPGQKVRRWGKTWPGALRNARKEAPQNTDNFEIPQRGNYLAEYALSNKT